MAKKKNALLESIPMLVLLGLLAGAIGGAGIGLIQMKRRQKAVRRCRVGRTRVDSKGSRCFLMKLVEPIERVKRLLLRSAAVPTILRTRLPSEVKCAADCLDS